MIVIGAAEMIRKQIYLTPDQNTALKQFASESGVPEAEVIRAAIDLHLHAVWPIRPDLSVWDEELRFLQHLTQQPLSAAPRTWQREELYER